MSLASHERRYRALPEDKINRKFTLRCSGSKWASAVFLISLVILVVGLRALDGRICTPLPSVLEEILVIRPKGSQEAEEAAAAYASPSVDPMPRLRHTPIMGFNTWNAFGCNISEDLILTIAASMKQQGLQEAGYTYVCIDDCWQADERGTDGSLQAHPQRFPSKPRVTTK